MSFSETFKPGCHLPNDIPRKVDKQASEYLRNNWYCNYCREYNQKMKEHESRKKVQHV